MALSSDPYEQKLYSLFQEHDVHSRGKLGREALMKLCKTLELAKPAELLKRLLRDGSRSQVSFGEFREGLLFILSGEEPEPSTSSPAQSHKSQRTVPGQADSSDGQNVSTGSPTVAVSNTSNSSTGSSSPQATAPGSIMSNTSNHPHHFTYRCDNDQSVAGESEASQQQSSVVKIIGCSNSSLLVVPSGESEDDLVQTTTGPATPTTVYD